jgi:hypothetical protein
MEQFINIISELSPIIKSNNFTNIINLCEKIFPIKLGEGTTRIVYQLDDNNIIKIAKNIHGLQQNEYEYLAYQKFNQFNALRKIYYMDLNKNYLIGENINTINIKQFYNLFNINYKEFIDNFAYLYHSKLNPKTICNNKIIINNHFNPNQDYINLIYSKFNNLIELFKVFKPLQLREILDIDNIGIDKNNNLTIIDYGWIPSNLVK